eukprot:COSAG05_NODE_2322_length_3236_cov_2.431304_1_plen_373_part_00
MPGAGTQCEFNEGKGEWVSFESKVTIEVRLLLSLLSSFVFFCLLLLSSLILLVHIYEQKPPLPVLASGLASGLVSAKFPLPLLVSGLVFGLVSGPVRLPSNEHIAVAGFCRYPIETQPKHPSEPEEREKEVFPVTLFWDPRDHTASGDELDDIQEDFGLIMSKGVRPAQHTFHKPSPAWHCMEAECAMAFLCVFVCVLLSSLFIAAAAAAAAAVAVAVAVAGCGMAQDGHLMAFTDPHNGGPREMAGVPAHSRIIEVDGWPVKSEREINKRLSRFAKDKLNNSRPGEDLPGLRLTFQEDHLPRGWNLEARFDRDSGKVKHAYVNTYVLRQANSRLFALCHGNSGHSCTVSRERLLVHWKSPTYLSHACWTSH